MFEMKGTGIDVRTTVEQLNSLNERLRNNRNDVSALRDRGKLFLYQQQQYQSAIADFKRIEEINNFADLSDLLCYANALHGDGQNQNALDKYEEYQRRGGDNHTFQRSSATTLNAMGQYWRSLRHCNDVISKTKDDFFALRNRGAAFYNLGYYEQAVNDLEAALKIQKSLTEKDPNFNIICSESSRKYITENLTNANNAVK